MSDETTPSDSTPAWDFPDDSIDSTTATATDSTTDIVHRRFASDPDSLLVAIVGAVTTLTNDEITDLPPLFETVDTEALTDLMISATDRGQHVEVSFVYQDCHVSVSSHGDIIVSTKQ